MDRVLVEGLRVQARVGVTREERNRRQRLLIDLTLMTDLKQAGRADRVNSTIDYAQVTQAVKSLIQARSFHLVEGAAEAIAERILKEFKPDQVRVRIRKFSVAGTTCVGAEITRGRRLRRHRIA